MLLIRPDQIKALDRIASDHLTETLVRDLRAKYPDRVASSNNELREAVEGWIEDAGTFGFRSNESVTRYVEHAAKTHGRRVPIKERIVVFVHLHHPALVTPDLQTRVATAVAFAKDHNVLQDEGITWLSIIMLAGYARHSTDFGWISATLLDTLGAEETRISAVHAEAVKRAWIRDNDRA